MNSRREGAQAVARRMADRVRGAVPEGLGRWGPAWNLVEAPSHDFLDALERWELAVDPSETEEEVLRDTVRAAADRLLAAWKDAGVAWDAAGRPAEPWRPDNSPSEPVEAGR